MINAQQGSRTSLLLVETRTGVDSLTFAERLSVKTNSVDWLLLSPNISLEYDLKGYNWSRWAMQLNLKGNPHGRHTYSPGFVLDHTQVRLEVRNYWRTRHLTNIFRPHKYPWQKVVSTRRLEYPENPKSAIAYFKGVYASYDNFSFLLGTKGVKGSAIGAGITYGLVKPFVGFNNGNSIDLELSASAGIAYTKYDKYGYDKDTHNYPLHEKGLSSLMPSLADLRVGFTYRFGNHPLPQRYRYRYDVDAEYQNYYDTKELRHHTNRTNLVTERNDLNDMEDMFWELYKKETGKKQVTRIRNKAERTGLDADLESEKAVWSNYKRALADSIATAKRHEKKTEDSLRELEVIERINYYDATYKKSGGLYGIDIKKLLRSKRKARQKEALANKALEEINRKTAEAEAKRELEIARIEKQAALEEARKAKAAEKEQAKKDAQKARKDAKAKREEDRKRDRKTAKEAAENVEIQKDRNIERQKAARSEMKEDMKRLKQEAKDTEEAMRNEIKTANEKLKAAQKAAEEEIRQAKEKAAKEKAQRNQNKD